MLRSSLVRNSIEYLHPIFILINARVTYFSLSVIYMSSPATYALRKNSDIDFNLLLNGERDEYWLMDIELININ